MTPSAALARVIVDELARCGVRDVVLCPGSRSAPIAYALLEATRAGRLRLHVRVDERSAAFLALGLGKASGHPAAVVTTSGTAVANLHPAVLESHEAGVPLLIITADRPPELRGTRANQTTDQIKFFGDAVRWFHDLGAPAEPAGQHAAWRTAVDRAVAAATAALGGDPGPAHLNVPLRDPLAPDLTQESPTWPESLGGRADGAPWTQVGLDPGVRGAQRSATGAGLEDEPRTVVVLGDLAGDAARAGELSRTVLRLAESRGWPVVAEPFGIGDRRAVAPHGPLVLSIPGLLEHAAARRILLVGRVTLSRATATLLRTPGAHVVAVTDRTRWADPGHVLHAVYPWSALGCDTRIADPDRCGPDAQWLQIWQRVGERLHQAVVPRLEEGWPWTVGSPVPGAPGAGPPPVTPPPCGPALADAVLRAIPVDATLFVGSSNSARDVEIARGPAGPFVAGSRGLAGIDGCVSTAAGMALGCPGTPTYALLGDLTFLHDANALLIGPGEPVPDLTVVVADDRGGGIFATLEYGEPARRAADPDGYERVFATPTQVDLGALCRAHGVAYERVVRRVRLAQLLARPPRGLSVVHVPIRRDAHRLDYAALREVAAGITLDG